MTYRLLIILFAATALLGCPEDDPKPDPEGEWVEPFDASGQWLLSVAGSSPDNIYTAGGTPTAGELTWYDGQEWSSVDVGDVPLLNWVHVFDDGTTFVAGNGGTILRGSGDSFAAMETPTTEDLWGVWGASPDDAWAVGGRGTNDSERTVLRYDGTDWKSVEVDLQRPGVNAFFKVWGSGADDVWIVGQSGAIVRWNGTEFEEGGAGTSRDLISVWGTGPDNVFVVGGRSNGFVARFDGEMWTNLDIAPAPGLNGVWASEEVVWVAGARGLLRQVEVADDGTLNVPRIAPVTALDLHAVFGVPGSDIITVGGNFQQPQGPYEGVVLEPNTP